jgi:hypothetical protein
MPMLRACDLPVPLASARNEPEPRALRACMRVLTAAACVFGATMLAGCASSDRLIASAPQGVDLSGEWRLNQNLSDDPQRPEEPKERPATEEAPERNPGGFGRPGTSMPGMPSGPGGIDPRGGGASIAAPASDLLPVLYQTTTDLPGSASDSGPTRSAAKAPAREGTVSHMLNAPELLQISQTGSKIVVKSMSDGTTDEYTAGEQRTIPFGTTQADRSAGWREQAFVVITKAHKGPSKEDDFALDAEGHLIFATLVTHVKKGPIDFKRVYDKIRTPN